MVAKKQTPPPVYAEQHPVGTRLRWIKNGRCGRVTGHIRGYALVRYDDDRTGPHAIKQRQECEVLYA
jgi:hypothetical protein